MGSTYANSIGQPVSITNSPSPCMSLEHCPATFKGCIGKLCLQPFDVLQLLESAFAYNSQPPSVTLLLMSTHA